MLQIGNLLEYKHSISQDFFFWTTFSFFIILCQKLAISPVLNIHLIPIFNRLENNSRLSGILEIGSNIFCESVKWYQIYVKKQMFIWYFSMWFKCLII